MPDPVLSSALPARTPGRIRYTIDGEPFDITSDRWTLEGDGRVAHIKWEDVHAGFAPGLVDTAKHVAASLLLVSKARTVENQIDALRRLAKFIAGSGRKTNEILGDDLERFFAGNTRRSDSALRPFFQHWRLQGFPGLHQSASEAIAARQFRSPDQSHITTLDPESGPYLDSEMIATDLALRSAFESVGICHERYLTAMIFRLYGQRPIMVANLKCGDVRTPQHNGSKHAEIRFPLAKKRDGGPSHGPGRPAPMLFTRVLEEYLDAICGNQAVEDLADAPLFPARSPAWKGSSERQTGRTNGIYAGHCTANTMSGRYRTVMDGLGVISPRTGKPMIFNPMRERHTIGTLLAMKGCSAAEIAAWLHHDDLGSCEAYVELGTRHHQLMHSLLDGRFTHLAGRFLGEVIPEDDVATISDHALIGGFEDLGAEPLGGCATGGCKALDELAAPFACLDGCPNLRLSLHADLRPLLEHLAAKKASARIQGDSEYHEALNRHIAQVVAADRALEAARADQEGS